jgi:hypothetical protein
MLLIPRPNFRSGPAQPAEKIASVTAMDSSEIEVRIKYRIVGTKVSTVRLL